MSHCVSLDHRDWDQVPLITFSINTALQDTILFTPFKLFHGRPPMNPIDVALNFEGCDFTSDPNEYIRQMEGCLAGAGTLVCTRANRSTERRAN